MTGTAESAARAAVAPPTEAQIILATLTGAVEKLQGAVPTGVEVVLHDLAKLPESIIAVAGRLTGRGIGDPATDLLLEMAVRGRYESIADYDVHHPVSGTLRCTTTVFHDSQGTPVCVLCVNRSMGFWQAMADAAASILTPGAQAGPEPLVPPVPPPAPADEPAPARAERFARSVPELADHVLASAVERTGRSVGQMRKPEKIEVVRELRDRGFFLLRDAAETAGHALGVSRFTIYNYLNEIDGAESAPGPATSSDR